MRRLRSIVNWLMLLQTVRAFASNNPVAAIERSARIAFEDSRYERRVTAALLLHLRLRGWDERFALAVAHWLDMLGRNAEAVPILKTHLDKSMHPMLACQYAWAIADTAPIEAFDDCKSFIECAATVPAQAPMLADTRAWMAYRCGNLLEAQRRLESICSHAHIFPDLAFHIARVSYDLGDKSRARQFLEKSFAHQRPFSGYYEAARLRSMLRLETVAEISSENVIVEQIPIINRFNAEENGLVLDLGGEMIILTWDRLWELADVSLEEKLACKLTPDRLGLVWPKLKFAQTSLHLKEAAMKGQVPPENRPLYGMYPATWYEPGGPLA